jgi:hypothetical protein
MRRIVAEKVAGQVAEWGHRGLIDGALLDELRQRYAMDVSAGRVLLRWLGFLAVFMLAASVLAVVGAAAGEAGAYLGAAVLAGLALVAWRQGTRLVTDRKQTFATSGAVLVTLSLLAGYGTMVIVWALPDGELSGNANAVMMTLTAAAALYTAYRFGLRWPLLLGVLLLIHALGHAHWYGGRGSYFMGIADERVTLAAATAWVVFGWWHERGPEERLESRTVGFGKIYIVVGLLYANMSLWFMTLPRGELVPILLFAAAGVVQLMLGARLHDGRFIGFAVVFLSLNLYTRLFENYWDDASRGTLLLGLGALAMVAGYLMERRARRLREEAAP